MQEYNSNKMVATAIIDHKVKGLLKGLRYISQIFENEKEREMVIGHPTDVKHVAHIGWDGGHAVNTPTWMNDFHSAPLSTTMDPDGREGVSPKSASQEIPLGGIPPPSPARDETASPKQPRRARRHASTEVAGSASPARDTSSSRGTRHSRKNQFNGSVPGSESPAREPSESRRGRRHHKYDNANGSGSGSGSAESSDLPSIPKQKKKERRSKGSTDGGSSRSSRRSKNPSFSEPGVEEAIARPVMIEEAA